MKGTKGMQRKVILFLMLLFGFSNNALSLNIRKTEVFFKKASGLQPNVATLADMVFEKPNEAFLPDEDDTVSYEFASSSDSLSDSVDSVFDDNNPTKEDEDDKVTIAKNDKSSEKIDTLVAKVEEKSLPVKKQEIKKTEKLEKVASLRPIDFVDVKPVKAKKIRTIANAKTKKSNDKFASIKVSEGEEVLVSSSDSIEKTVKKDVSEKTVASVENLDISSPVSNKEEIKANDSKKSNAKKSTKSKKQKATETIAKAKSSSLSSTDTNEKSVAKNDVANDINADSSDVVSKESDDSLDDNPFGVIVSKTKKSDKKKKDIDVAANSNPFVKAFSAIKPETNKKATSSKKSSSEKSTKGKKKSSVASAEIIKKDLRRAYLSGNQYLSAYEDEEESSSEDENEEALEEDVDEEVEEQEEENEEEYEDDEGFKKQKDVEDALEGKGDKKVPVEKVDIKDVKKKLQDTKKAIVAPSGPLKAGTREVLQMKIDFQEGSSAVSGESVNLIRSFAQIATEQPTNSIEITIPEIVMNNPKKKKLTARRLSIVSNILRNAGISDRQILPVLSDRDEDSFAFRVVRNDAYTTLRISKGKDIFGEEENVKEYNIMKW